jgi:hypothetical protein
MAKKSKATGRRPTEKQTDRVQLVRNVATPDGATLQYGCTMTRREADRLGLAEGRDYKVFAP